MDTRPEPGLGAAPWDKNAAWWARTFTEGADPEYELQIIPLVVSHLHGCRRIVDLGCGEGHVSRSASQTVPGTTVIGIDPSVAQLATAAVRAGGPHYVRGHGEELPYRSGSVDAVVCCLVIEHVADADTLMAEVTRVLGPAGRFLLLVNHPIYQGAGSGFVDDQILGEHYWRVGPYLHEEVAIEEVEPGIEIPFAHRPLSRYVNPLAELGMYLTRLEEPPPLPEFLRTSPDPHLESLIPRLLLMRFERR